MKRRKNETIEEFRARNAEYKRKYRKTEAGDRLRQYDRERYAKKKGEPVRAYTRTK